MRSLALHPSRPIVASVGLDHFLRLHDTRTRAPLAKVYLKQQLTGGVAARLLARGRSRPTGLYKAVAFLVLKFLLCSLLVCGAGVLA